MFVDRWVRNAAAVLVAAAGATLTSPGVSALPTLVAALYGACLPRLAEDRTATEERAVQTLRDLAVVGGFALLLWLSGALPRFPAGTWAHVVAQVTQQLAAVTLLAAVVSWASLSGQTWMHWHHHAGLPGLFLALSVGLGAEYAFVTWTLAGWATHLAVDAVGPQGVVCGGRRTSARLYSGAPRSAVVLLAVAGAGCLGLLGARWTPDRPLRVSLSALSGRPGPVPPAAAQAALLVAGAVSGAVVLRRRTATPTWTEGSGEDARRLPERVAVQLHPETMDGLPCLPVLVDASARAGGRPLALVCCLEPPPSGARSVEFQVDGRSVRFEFVSPTKFRPEWCGSGEPDAWADVCSVGLLSVHGVAAEILLAALADARGRGHRVVQKWHLALAACARLRRGRESFRERASQRLLRLPELAPLNDDSSLLVSPGALRIVVEAERRRRKYGASKAALWKYLWLSIPGTSGEEARWEARTREADIVLRMPDDLPAAASRPPGESESGSHEAPEPRPETRAAVQEHRAGGSVLDHMCQELVTLARRGALPPVYGRDAELEQVVEVLMRAEKSNPVLVGEAGVGKTAVVHLLAQTVAHHPERLPERLRGIRIYEWEHGRMVAGTMYRGQFEERLQRLVDALAADRNAVLFVDEIHLLVGAGQAELGAVPGAGQLLKPALASDRIRVIGATTLQEYRVIEEDPALERRFQPVRVEELSPEMTERVLRAVVCPYLERRHGVRIRPEAVQAAVALTVRYVADRKLPDKAKEVLDQAAARVARKGTEEAVTERHVARIVEERTGIPVVVGTEDAGQVLSRVTQYLEQRVVGQTQATQTVARAVTRYLLGIRPPGRPLGPFLFYGPTGVGKTELAKAVAAVIGGPRAEAVTVNLSEFHDEYTVSRLVGAPPGYVGYREGGQLTEAVRRNPYCVVLLDEVEKAHPRVLDALLRLLDEGKLTDGSGRVVDFSHACVILTSNLGSAAFRGVDPDDGAAVEGNLETALKALRAALRPEFFNRLTPVPFRPLGRSSMERIARHMVHALCREVQANLRPSGILVEVRVEEEAIGWLARKGYDPELGARPLRRLVEEQLGDLLARAVAGRQGTVRVVVRGGPEGLHVQVGG